MEQSLHCNKRHKHQCRNDFNYFAWDRIEIQFRNRHYDQHDRYSECNRHRPSLPILFTANTASPTAGYWKGISFGSTSANSQITYSTIEYGGGGGNGNIRSSGAVIQIQNDIIRYSSNYGIYATGVTNITLSNNTFTNNSSYAASLGFNSGTFTSLAGNSGSGNGKNGIALSGSIGSNTTLPVNPGFPYIIPGSGLSVNSSVTLTIPPASVIKFDSIQFWLVGRWHPAISGHVRFSDLFHVRQG